jgi:hypothetical protein
MGRQGYVWDVGYDECRGWDMIFLGRECVVGSRMGD